MIKLYPDRPVAALVRVFADLMATGWTLAWAVLGFLIYQTIMGLEVIANGITGTGTTFNSWIKQFHDAILEGMIQHDGDAVLTAHVAATVAERVGDNWRIRKVKQSMVIDAVVAAIMAHYHARRAVVLEPMVAWG